MNLDLLLDQVLGMGGVMVLAVGALLLVANPRGAVGLIALALAGVMFPGIIINTIHGVYAAGLGAGSAVARPVQAVLAVTMFWLVVVWARRAMGTHQSPGSTWMGTNKLSGSSWMGNGAFANRRPAGSSRRHSPGRPQPSRRGGSDSQRGGAGRRAADDSQPSRAAIGDSSPWSPTHERSAWDRPQRSTPPPTTATRASGDSAGLASIWLEMAPAAGFRIRDWFGRKGRA